MQIRIRGAEEHNLKNVDVDIQNCLTVITGVSGSGKSSLIFDTLYKEARRRFLEAFSINKDEIGLNPAKVKSITGIGPTIALGQNLLNRNPNSTLSSASGLSPLLRLLYARFGERRCHICGSKLSILKEDEIIRKLESLTKEGEILISAILVQQVKGSHQTLLNLLLKEFDQNKIIIDEIPWENQKLNSKKPHNIQIEMTRLNKDTPLNAIRELLHSIASLGANSLIIKGQKKNTIISRVPSCFNCGTWFSDLEPTHFNKFCMNCKGKGCEQCNNTGLYPQASTVYWSGLLFTDLLELSIGEFLKLIIKENLSASDRLIYEIKKRLEALEAVGLDYLTLNRVSPTLSRGESQRVRLAVALTSQLEDITHVLDEPTIGQHPSDIARLLPIFKKLRGPVIYIEHDQQAAAIADTTIDIGPGAGSQGGEIIFIGTPAELWKADTLTGKYFSSRKKVQIPKKRPEPQIFLTIKGAKKYNLKNFDVRIPLNRLSVITGVSGSGKSTLVEEILYPTLKNNVPTGCDGITGSHIKPVMVDQSPIGKNPRSNPATYTKISEIIRKIFSKVSGFSATHFSFNTSEGACPTCKGMGAIEIKMTYLPSSWIKCSACEGDRFSEEILSTKVPFGDQEYSIADFYNLPISVITKLFDTENRLSQKDIRSIRRMLGALNDIGLGYLSLGQPSPTLSGGEGQRVKLSKFLGKQILKNQLLILDEPSTGLHPSDLSGLLTILGRLIKVGATVVIIEHNVDIIRAADWVIDLGPGSGHKGGQLIYEGPLKGLMKVKKSYTAQALDEIATIEPKSNLCESIKKFSPNIVIKNAHIHNLKNIDLNIPKQAFTVITGVSGSGKSSLIMDTLEIEARRRYLETLSMYERQGIHESAEAQVNEISGLGITALITSEKKLHASFFNVRHTIGRVTDILLYLASIFAYNGEYNCPKCGIKMIKKDIWRCNKCNNKEPIAKPRHFISSNYAAACKECNGVGYITIPNPDKLIINPDQPLCKGAMYSPGFFPKGYLCKPYNGGYYIVQALATRYGFDPLRTPWNKMNKEAQDAFLYGDNQTLVIQFENKKGQKSTRNMKFLGFYDQWVREWDVGGTYTDKETCKSCKGSKLRTQYLAVTFEGFNIHKLCEIPLKELYYVLMKTDISNIKLDFVNNNLKIILTRLNFLIRVGLGYINLNRVVDTLSAGEAQRIRIAGLLGSDLTSLTVLLDEPSRGLHPSELQVLLKVLIELRDKGNSIIIIEHDPLFIEAADFIVDMGPSAGINGGKIVAKGNLEEIKKANTITGMWLSGKKKFKIPKKLRKPNKWLTIYGARENNLKCEVVEIPKGLLVGLCGVSGSGKSTLLIDTLGRFLAPMKYTTSVAYVPMEPGEFDRIEGALPQTIIIDQAKVKIGNPLKFLGLEKQIIKLYAETEDAKILEIQEKELSKKCLMCRGRGFIKTDMKFLPDIVDICENCKGSSYQPNAWKVRFNGVALPRLNNFTIDEAYDLFKENNNIAVKLKLAQEVGLGYLQLNQPAHSLSGGECQRLKIVKELSKKTIKNTLYILDEPTIGQHLEDVSRLIKVLNMLVDRGHTVIIIEHHPHLLASCDWLIELGPGGGSEGGRVISSGTPIDLAKGSTPTAPYLKRILESEI